jgi:hypothetical protein
MEINIQGHWIKVLNKLLNGKLA